MKLFTLYIKLKFLEHFIIKCVKKLKKAAPRFEEDDKLEELFIAGVLRGLLVKLPSTDRLRVDNFLIYLLYSF